MSGSIFRSLSYGMYIVTSVKGDKMNGQIANSVFQVTSEPVRVAVSINKQNLTHEYILSSGMFCVSVLEKETPLKFIGLFGFKSGREVNKLSEATCRITSHGALPAVIDYAIGYFEAKVIDSVDVGTHTLFIGEVTESELLKPDAEPMTYSYYHEVKKGKSPKKAPTYIEEQGD